MSKDFFRAMEAGMINTVWLEGFLQRAILMRQYSLQNVARILTQLPNATYVAGRQQYEELGAFVRNGATPIRICAPEGRSQKVRFVEVEVFDISQTTAHRKQTSPEDKHPAKMAKLAHKMGFSTRTCSMESSWKIVEKQVIFIKEGLPPAITAQLICQEMAYWQIWKEYPSLRNITKSLSIAVSYCVESALGGYIPNLAKEVKEDLRKGDGFYKNLNLILKSSKRILKAIE